MLLKLFKSERGVDERKKLSLRLLKLKTIKKSWNVIKLNEDIKNIIMNESI